MNTGSGVMDKQMANEDVDRRIRLVREVSEQRTTVSDEHLEDLLRRHPQGPLNSTDAIRSRFQNTISVSSNCVMLINCITNLSPRQTIINLEAEYTKKIQQLEHALEKTRDKM